VGVSKAAVSYVLGKGDKEKKVSPDTARRIRKVADELGYVPNSFARSLKSHKTGNVTFLFSELALGWSEFIIRGARRVLDAAGYVSFIGVHSRDPERQKREIRSIISRRDEGVVLTPIPGAEADYQMFTNYGIPFVLLTGGMASLPEANCVYWDDQAAARVAVQYLIDKGFKRIGYAGPIHDKSEMKDRFDSYLLTMQDNGLSVRDEWHDEVVGGYPLTLGLDRVFAQREVPEALFVPNDHHALAVLDELYRLEIRVPEDVAVISLRDIPEARLRGIGLTTVHEPVADIGEEAAKTLLTLIENPDCAPIRKKILSTELMIRSSA